ncbi:PREDICTED: F-box/kelch-repeat protein At1g57790-like isoform X2 [Ipomoea nil]|uniref:F-box/kelch-repeat protein At1g57790-like isoform X2 n=1 Tax=Ipomoea nil TaxID=35883 RepID=UPI0009011294|nr:PREDICTED: F-box/kelch-repeat protein At1g57790-like isoform X2 [Ipomoea nil]
MNPPSPSKCPRKVMVDDAKELERRWSDLPPELLSKIANCLGCFDLLRFRFVCKDWHFASLTASASVESSPGRKPCFLLHGESAENCILYSQVEKKKYMINIPELREATCLASNQGWLLLFQQGVIFFFCPFSGSRIDLPAFPQAGAEKEFSGHVGAFSSPPTSPDCTVAVICRKSEHRVEMNVLDRKSSEWTKHEYSHFRGYFRTIKCATCHDGVFYFIDDTHKVLTFSAGTGIWKIYRIVDSSEETEADSLPFVHMDKYFSASELKKKMELGDDVSIVTCAASLPGSRHEIIINNENIDAMEGAETQQQLKGIWIQPRFFQIPPEYTWSL